MALVPDYCPTCGTALTERVVEGRTRRFCPSCDRPVYRNPKPAAGVLVVRTDAVLLVKRTNPPAVGHWSVPAGFLEVDEPPRQGAARELREETGLRVDPDTLTLATTRFVESEDRHNVLVIVYTVPEAAIEGTPSAGSDAAAVRFWTRTALDEIPLEPGYRATFENAIDETATAQGDGGSPS